MWGLNGLHQWNYLIWVYLGFVWLEKVASLELFLFQTIELTPYFIFIICFYTMHLKRLNSWLPDVSALDALNDYKWQRNLAGKSCFKCTAYITNNKYYEILSLYNFLLINATDRSKIRSDQKRLFIAVSLYPVSFFANTPLKVSSFHPWHSTFGPLHFVGNSKL